MGRNAKVRLDFLENEWFGVGFTGKGSCDSLPCGGAGIQQPFFAAQQEVWDYDGYSEGTCWNEEEKGG